MVSLRVVAAFAILVSLVTGCLRAAEPREIVLFADGTLDGWSGGGQSIDGVWELNEGMLHCIGRGPSLVSDADYGDFEIEMEWKIAPDTNSGFKYKVKQYDKAIQGASVLGIEYQMIDEDAKRYQNHLEPVNITGALYALYPATVERPLNLPGEWNTAKIVVRGPHLEHWLNGAKLLEVDTSSADWREHVAASKFIEVDHFGENALGKLMFTNHGGGEAWFKNIKLRVPASQDD